jgi:uncharacterized cupredoxin-like copper-binding protein
MPLVVATALVSVLAACGGGGSAAPSSAPATAAGSPAASGAASAPASSPSASGAAASGAAAGAPIAVEVKEWAVTPASKTATAGSIVFNVKNAGSAVHEFVVVKTDLKADALPVSGSTVDETKVTVVDEIEDIAVGATPSLTVTLAAGHYALICNVETHYGLGMHSDFDVS